MTNQKLYWIFKDYLTMLACIGKKQIYLVNFKDRTIHPLPFIWKKYKKNICLEGEGSGDLCLTQPCKNKGVCVQLKYGGYRYTYILLSIYPSIFLLSIYLSFHTYFYLSNIWIFVLLHCNLLARMLLSNKKDKS